MLKRKKKWNDKFVEKSFIDKVFLKTLLGSSVYELYALYPPVTIRQTSRDFVIIPAQTGARGRTNNRA